jgi:hypothetical protein
MEASRPSQSEFIHNGDMVLLSSFGDQRESWAKSRFMDGFGTGVLRANTGWTEKTWYMGGICLVEYGFELEIEEEDMEELRYWGDQSLGSWLLVGLYSEYPVIWCYDLNAAE